MHTPTIDFVSDIICPWCFIGLSRLETALADAKEEQASITFRPFQLDPSTPPEGADLRQRLAAKVGGDPEPLFRRVEEVAKQSGLPIDFSKVKRTPNTLKAHALLTYAHERDLQRRVARALFEAYFVEGRDIGKRDVLVSIAQAHGMSDRDAEDAISDEASLGRVRAEAESASLRGIRGVPFTIFGGKLAVSGAQSTAMFKDAFERARLDHAPTAP